MSIQTAYAPLGRLKRPEVALRTAQQTMSRKVKFSNNGKKAKARVSKTHSRIANGRRDLLQKPSTAIRKNHAMVCIEDLQGRKKSKLAAGTADVPGSNVRAKSGLNKSLLDQGWFAFRRRTPAAPVGHVSADNRQTQAKFACVECGFEGNADVVGAVNILSCGMRLLRDAGQDTGDASPGRPQGSWGVSPAVLWFEP
ncbi:transposase [Chthonomonas calidirosea]|nr:transposase [Chthonomonas calidirosea]CEK19197.1 transposase [Chthonomonas calidirosea]